MRFSFFILIFTCFILVFINISNFRGEREYPDKKTLLRAKSWLKNYHAKRKHEQFKPDQYQIDYNTLIVTKFVDEIEARNIRKQKRILQIKQATLSCPANYEEIWSFVHPRDVLIMLYDKQDEII